MLLKLKTFFKNKFLFLFLIVTVFLFLFSRLLFLNSDIPHKDLIQHSSMDAIYFVESAYFWSHSKKISSAHSQFPPNIQESYKNQPQYLFNPFGSLLSFFSLKLLGKNLYGLNVSGVLFGIFSFLFMLYGLHFIYERKDAFSIKRDSSSHKIFFFSSASVFLISNFYFLFMSRVTDSRMPVLFFFTAILALSAYMSKKDRLPLGALFLLGFLAGCQFISLPTNYFIAPALFFPVLMASHREGGIPCVIKKVTVYGVGFLSLLFVFHSYLWLTWDTNLIEHFQYAKSIWGHRIEAKDGLMYPFRSLLFIYNPSILFAFLFSLFLFKTKRNENFFYQVLWSSFLFVTFFSATSSLNIQIPRKLIHYLPLSLLIIAVCIVNKKMWLWKTWEKAKVYKYYGISLVLTLLTALSPKKSPILFYEDVLFYRKMFPLEHSLSLLSLLGFATLFFYFLYKGFLKKWMFVVFLFFFIFPESFLSLKHIYLKPKYSMEKSMKSIAQKYHGEYIAGLSASNLFLYGGPIPILDAYHPPYYPFEHPLRNFIKDVEHLRKMGMIKFLFIGKPHPSFEENIEGWKLQEVYPFAFSYYGAYAKENNEEL